MNLLISTLCIAYYISFGLEIYGGMKNKKKIENIGLWGMGVSITLLVIIAIIFLNI